MNADQEPTNTEAADAAETKESPVTSDQADGACDAPTEDAKPE